jgi:uncharacterized membrane protein YraQ (UPF0718 family)
MESQIAGAVLRFLQALTQAIPTILVGLIVAGILRRLLGHAGTRRLFGNNTRRSLLQAWLVGMLLPVCSLGVIPVVREMRRAGVSGGGILAFGLTAPLFNPISVLYGLTLADPVVIITFSFCSLVIVTVVGVAWDRLFPNTATAEPEPPRVAYGAKRMLSIGLFAAREVTSPTSWYILAGLSGVMLLSLILPHGYLQMAAEHDDPWAPLFMTAVAIPAYATPMTAMMQLASMFQHGNSVGAAFALLALGAGTNLGLIAWMTGQFGVRRSVVWFVLLVGVVVALSYGVDRPLYPHGVEPAGHTHAFDMYCAPFRPGDQGVMKQVSSELREQITPYEIVALGVASLLVVAAAVLSYWDGDHRAEAWLESQPEGRSRMDIVLPGTVLGGTALIGVVALSVVGCYVYYPPPDEVLEEMQIVNVEVVASALSKDWDTAEFWIPIYDDWTRKLQVSMFLRGQSLTPYRRAKAAVLRDKLELLEHEIEDKEMEESQKLARSVNRAFRRLRGAYGPP